MQSLKFKIEDMPKRAVSMWRMLSCPIGFGTLLRE